MTDISKAIFDIDGFIVTPLTTKKEMENSGIIFSHVFEDYKGRFKTKWFSTNPQIINNVQLGFTFIFHYEYLTDVSLDFPKLLLEEDIEPGPDKRLEDIIPYEDYCKLVGEHSIRVMKKIYQRLMPQAKPLIDKPDRIFYKFFWGTIAYGFSIFMDKGEEPLHFSDSKMKFKQYNDLEEIRI